MPAIVLEKPKLSRPMWNSLKSHIIRERQRKKQEQEADAEVERQRREREDQQKEQEMTLEETKEQVAQSESRLSQLKEDKHQLFLQLKKVLNEDDTRRKIKESSFNDMMMFHPYPSGAPLVHPSPHGSVYMHPNLGTSRPVFNGGKEETILNLQGVPPSSLYGQGINMVPSLGHQSQTNQKRSRSPSPPPQLYHSYKPPALSPYNSKSIGSPYGGSPAVPGSIFYTHSVSVSAAHSAASAGYQLPPGSLYSYPNQSASSRPTYSVQTPTSSKDDAKHHATVYVGQGNVLPQNPQRSIPPRNSGPSLNQGYHQPIEHMMIKNSNSYGSSESEKKIISPSLGSSPNVSSNVNSVSSAGGLRPHTGLLTPISVSGASHPSGIPIQQQNHASKSGSIITGNPLRPPPSTGYHSVIPASNAQNNRLPNTQSGGQTCHPTRYYGNSS